MVQNLTLRDRHISEIAANGRTAWQKAAGHNHRSRAENQMGRRQRIIGPKVTARNSENQEPEARNGVQAVNRMTALGHLVFTRTA